MRGQQCFVTVACIVAICSVSLHSDATGPASSAAASRVAVAVVNLTNVERASRGRSRLRTNPGLMRAAQIQAEQSARAGKIEHVLPKAAYPRAEDRLAAAGYRWETCGENLALGQSSAAEALDSWMHSRGHRQNILNPHFTEIGAGYAVDRAGRPYYVQVFGSPLPS